MTRSLIGAGSNLGDRAATLDAAVAALVQASDVQLLQQSARQLTLPVGGCTMQNQFLNGAVLVETSLSPQELLALLQQIENQHGRERHQRWGARTLDLDLLLYGDAVIDTPALSLPHSRMSFRRFVLEPAVEIAGDMVHPTIGWPLERLLDHLDSGADALALVSRDDSARHELVAELLCRFEIEPSGPLIDDEVRWSSPATTWLRMPGDVRSSGEPKLTVVVGKETPTVPGRGPTLYVPAADGQDMATDVFAAVEAVWPRLVGLV